MSRDTILTDEDSVKYSYDNIKTQGWLNGQPSGAEQLCEWLINKSVEMFKDGRIDDATKLRALALEAKSKVVPALKANAERHKKEHPEQIDSEGYDD